MAVGPNGDVTPTLHHPACIMDNPGDQAGQMVQEFEAYVQDELTIALWISIMWILISLAISLFLFLKRFLSVHVGHSRSMEYNDC